MTPRANTDYAAQVAVAVRHWPNPRIGRHVRELPHGMVEIALAPLALLLEKSHRALDVNEGTLLLIIGTAGACIVSTHERSSISHNPFGSRRLDWRARRGTIMPDENEVLGAHLQPPSCPQSSLQNTVS
jgi:hypothetical protein